MSKSSRPPGSWRLSRGRRCTSTAHVTCVDVANSFRAVALASPPMYPRPCCPVSPQPCTVLAAHALSFLGSGTSSVTIQFGGKATFPAHTPALPVPLPCSSHDFPRLVNHVIHPPPISSPRRSGLCLTSFSARGHATRMDRRTVDGWKGLI